MSRPHRIMWLFDVHKFPELCQLRGGPVFQVLTDAGVATVEVPDEKQQMWLGRGTMFVDAGQVALAAIVQDQQFRWEDEVRVIVDVHFPILRPERILAFQPGTDDSTRDVEMDEAAIAFWCDPRNRDVAIEMVRDADAVTCPHPDWAHDLRYLNPNVFVLPDVTDTQSGVAFAVGWAKAIAAMRDRKIPWWTQWTLRRAMRRRLKKLDWTQPPASGKNATFDQALRTLDLGPATE